MNKYELFENEYRKYQIALESYCDIIPSESLDALRDIYTPVANMSVILIDLIKERYCHSESDEDYQYPTDIIKIAAASDSNIKIHVWNEFRQIRNNVSHSIDGSDIPYGRLTENIVPEFVREFEYLKNNAF